MKNEIGDKCFADSMKADIEEKFYTTYKDDGTIKRTRSKKVVRLYAEVDGMHFDSEDYRTKKSWLQSIVKRVYDCAMGQLNFDNKELNVKNKNLVKSFNPDKINVDEFDDIEVDGMVTDLSGRENAEPVSNSEDKPDFWSVFGHYKTGGRTCLCDCQDEATANLIANALKHFVK